MDSKLVRKGAGLEESWEVHEMKLERLFDPDLLAFHLREKNVRQQHHDALPLSVYNYSQRAQYENVWDSCVEQCRGLVVDDSGEVVARPWRKFWNLATGLRPETMPANLPTFSPEITTKLDGFLLVLSWYDNQLVFSSRGSFVSAHAKWANDFWKARHDATTLPAGKTCLFEGLCADLRIVVKYPEDSIVLLGVVEIETGRELDYQDRCTVSHVLGCPLAPLHHKSIPELEAEMQTSKEGEGYVVSWLYPDRPSLKLKMRAAEYLRLHRLLTECSPRHVWDALRSGSGIDALLADTPKDFQEWVNGWVMSIGRSYQEIDKAIQCYLLDALGMTLPFSLDGLEPTLERVKNNRDLRRAFAAHVKYLAGPAMEGGVFTRAFSPAAYESWVWRAVEPHGEAFRREG